MEKTINTPAVGQWVSWKSSSAGVTKEKIGKVLAIIDQYEEIGPKILNSLNLGEIPKSRFLATAYGTLNKRLFVEVWETRKIEPKKDATWKNSNSPDIMLQFPVLISQCWL